ncbi:MAG: hypothetical protein WDW36_000266 [Sanguina aurantia]
MRRAAVVASLTTASVTEAAAALTVVDVKSETTKSSMTRRTRITASAKKQEVTSVTAATTSTAAASASLASVTVSTQVVYPADAAPAKKARAPRRLKASSETGTSTAAAVVPARPEGGVKSEGAGPAKKARAPRRPKAVADTADTAGGGEAGGSQTAPVKRVRKAAQPKDAAPKPPAPYFLMKNEPDELNFAQLEGEPGKGWHWDGVRNYQARNFMRSMPMGQQALFYHSSCKVPGIMGICEVVSAPYPDHTQFDPTSKYYDATSTREAPKWWMVDVRFVRKFARQITLEELRKHREAGLSGMMLWSHIRLSIQPVTQQEWDYIVALDRGEPVTGDAAPLHPLP